MSTKFFMSVAILLALTVFATAIPAHSLPAASDPAKVGLDGSSINGCGNTTTSCSGTLTTSQPNEILIAYAGEGLDAYIGISCTFSISDTAGLNWLPRTGPVFQYNGRDQFQEFWAKSASALSSDVVTESISGCGPNYNGVQVFGISGANFNNPFDPNLSLPGTANGDTTVASVGVTISTSTANDIVFAGVDHNIGEVPAMQAGFTRTTAGGHGGFDSEYEIATGTLTNFAVTFGFTTPYYWEMIADAVQPASSTSPPPPPAGTPSFTMSVSVAPLYFPGDTAVIYAQANLNGLPTSISNESVVLIPPTGANITLKVLQVATGISKATYSIPVTGSIGSYGVAVTVQKQGTGSASGLVTFEVKSTWLQAHGTTIIGATSVIGALLVVGVVVAWKQGGLTRRKDQLLSPSDSAQQL